MTFSGALTLTDLNDFISPSQACIKPVEQLDKLEREEYVGAKTEIVVDSTGSYFEVGAQLNLTPSYPSDEPPRARLEQAQISLTDCLACSGCITSAESVLITMQSHAEVFHFLSSNQNASGDDKKTPILSIAPQSLASLATALAASASSSSPPLGLTPRRVLRRVQTFCKDILGFSQVLDITFARHLALQEHVREFEERKTLDSQGGDAAQGQLPMLASACPGWVCYAEKAHAEMLPFISRTKSPQQIMGTLVKEWMGKRRGVTPDKVYHVSVMPCYDKKLEASRQDFYNDIYATRDVDCVITTGELQLMMKDKGWDLSEPVPDELDDETSVLPTGDEIRFPELLQHSGSSSGSYMMSIIDHLMRESSVPLTLSSKLVRNTDYEELNLVDESTGKAVFKGAKCYGFRNLQNVVRKVGRERGVRVGGGAAGRLSGKTGVGRRAKNANGVEERQYDYVEVMACPSGCVNGGGQLKPLTSVDEEGYQRNWKEDGVILPEKGGESGVVGNAKWGDKEWTRRVEAMYWLEGEAVGIKIEPPHGGPAEVGDKIGTWQVTMEGETGHGGLGGGERANGVGRGQMNKTDGGCRSTEQGRNWIRQEGRLKWADELAGRVLNELCGRGDGGVKNRHRFFRTEYHAVESDVVGLAVKW